MRKQNSGFSIVEILIVLAVLALIIGGGLWVWSNQNKPSQQTSNTSQPSNQKSSEQLVMWMQNGDGSWTPQSQAPTCPTQPMLKPPADLATATSILYPGQTRGGNYKAHGGIRFDSSKDNSVTVMAPIDGYVYRGARYLVNGETQYTFDVINSCGVMFRLGHLLKLTPKFQALADKFPAAQENDSRTTNIDTTVNVTAGEAFATKVGTTVGGVNTFFDFGVYDLRSPNSASKQAGYLQQHDLELAGHAVCWLKGWLPTGAENIVNSLPAGDPTSGKNSDYCK